MKLLLKYQNVVRAHQVAAELVSLSKSIKQVLALLTDSERCEFVGVAIPERMSLEETADLAKSLEKLQVPLRRLLINGVTPGSKICRFCRSRRKLQEQVIEKFKTRFRALEIVIAVQQPQEIRGSSALLRHFDGWKKVPRFR